MQPFAREMYTVYKSIRRDEQKPMEGTFPPMGPQC